MSRYKVFNELVTALQEHQAMADTLTRCQKRCTELVMENRKLKAQLEKLNTCVVCQCTLMEIDAQNNPPHCEDCIVPMDYFEDDG